jgi:starch synthase
MHIVELSSEVHPFVKTGGLADVCGALPVAFDAAGHDVDVFLPGYRRVLHGPWSFGPPALTLHVPAGAVSREVRVLSLRLPGSGVRWHVLDCPPLFDRDGLYDSPWGAYADNGERFAVFSRAALAATEAMGVVPDILHAHDWQAGLAPVYLRTLFAGSPAFTATRSVLTLHNIAYQGRFGPDVLPFVGLDRSHFNPNELEFYGVVSYLKGGAAFADALTTVSPRYAREIQTPEFGEGLEGLLRYRALGLHGILNGIDDRTWNPATDPHLPAHYDREDLSGKAACKRHIQWRFGLPERAETPLLAFIGRLADQKGIDLLAGVLPDLVAHRDLQVLVLGTGSPSYHGFFTDLRARFPQKVGIFLGFDESLAHRIEAGTDIFLMPSRYEPCGLNQMYSLRYGTVPVVRETGGLADTVVDATPEAIREGRATGFVFRDYHPGALAWAIDRALAARGNPMLWQSLQRTGMSQDWSWARSGERYLALFRDLLPPDLRAAEERASRESRRPADPRR